MSTTPPQDTSPNRWERLENFLTRPGSKAPFHPIIENKAGRVALSVIAWVGTLFILPITVGVHHFVKWVQGRGGTNPSQKKLRSATQETLNQSSHRPDVKQNHTPVVTETPPSQPSAPPPAKQQEQQIENLFSQVDQLFKICEGTDADGKELPEAQVAAAKQELLTTIQKLLPELKNYQGQQKGVFHNKIAMKILRAEPFFSSETISSLRNDIP